MPAALYHHLRWWGPVLVLAVAALLRFWALGRPGTLVFDELYYVRDAISQLAHGVPTVWPDDDPDMSGSRATAFTADPANAVHPPLGKWLIGLGILAFGPGDGWGWRSAVALAGVATVGVTMRLGYLVSRNMLIACLAGLLLAIDGVHITLTRVALLDGFLTFFIVLGALFVWKDIERTRPSAEWARPWLVAAGLAFGAAAAVKWSGIYPLACFLVFIAVRDLAARLRSGSERPVLRSLLQALATAVLTIPAAVLAYLTSWTGWILHRAPGDWLPALVEYHVETFQWHSTLNAAHPYAAHPLTWPLALAPTAMYEQRWTQGCPWDECVSGISALPNPFVTWAGVAALILLAVLAIRRVRRRDPIVLISVFVITGYLSAWLPWVLTFSRSAVFQFYAVAFTPFAALALALALGLLCGLPMRTRTGEQVEDFGDPASLEGRRIAVAVFVAAATGLALLFFPVWSGTPIPEWFWESHMWLPDWA